MRRAVPLLGLVILLSSCGTEQPVPEEGAAGRPGAPWRPAKPNVSAPVPLPAERVASIRERIASIRERIERCGGALACDADGEPVEIDLAVGRGSADEAAFEAALACPALERLRVRAGRLSADALWKIAALTSLEELALFDAPIDDDCLGKLAHGLPALRRLALRNTFHVTDRGISALAPLAQLTHLTLIDLGIGNEALGSIARLPALASLDLRMCSHVNAAGLAALADAGKLGELKLGGHGIDDAAMGIVAALPRLNSLTVEDASITADGFARLAHKGDAAERIQTLCFARCFGLNDDALGPLEAFANLRRLTLRDLPVTGAFLTKLPSPERLELLSLSQTFLAGEAFGRVAACRNLKRLELAQNLLTPDALKKIATLSELEYLNLSECGIGDDELELLVGLDKLKTLIVDGNPSVSQEAVARILGPSPPE
ncbi:MAG: leucine-rich repeat domain-containing protein [Planctomycetota bacterium]